MNVDFSDLSSVNELPKGSVLLLKANNKDAAEPYLEKYDEGQGFQHLIWFPEEYKDFDFGWWWDYFMHRKTEGPYWTSGTEGIAFFPKSTP